MNDSYREALFIKFPLAVRGRGDVLHEQGCVRAVVAESKRVLASVEDEDSSYVVELELRRGGVAGGCSCGALETARPCAHLWATLRGVCPGDFVSDQVLAWLDAPVSGARSPTWRALFRDAECAFPIQAELERELEHKRQPRPELVYVVEPWRVRLEEPALSIYSGKRKVRGGWRRLKEFTWTAGERLGAHAADQHILDILHAPSPLQPAELTPGHRLTPCRASYLLPLLCETQRCYVRRPDEEESSGPLVFSTKPWLLGIRLAGEAASDHLRVRGFLCRGDERTLLHDPAHFVWAGHLVRNGEVAPIDCYESPAFLKGLCAPGGGRLPVSATAAFLDRLLKLPRLPLLELEPPYQVVSTEPVPRLVVRNPQGAQRQARELPLEPEFLYGDVHVPANCERAAVRSELDPHKIVLRNLAFEQRALRRLSTLGATGMFNPLDLELESKRLPQFVRTLVREGWQVDAEDARYEPLRGSRFELSSSVDWLELNGSFHFGEELVTLPQLLRGLDRTLATIRLGDGVVGVLPEEWLERIRLLEALGKHHETGLRFAPGQASILEKALDGLPEVDTDAGFKKLCERLSAGRTPVPQRAPEAFRGRLRPYQEEGLGWFAYLQDLGLGGCLADDMGLGKTVQVLALFLASRDERPSGPPSLVVAPSSVVFNWAAEAGRFAPGLRLLDYTGSARAERWESEFAQADVVLTSYGVLRRDVDRLADQRFRWVVLDEAQAIKNQASQTWKAARRLQGDQRLALSGTPLENHLGELRALLEFLQPGLLGRGKTLDALLRVKGGADPSGGEGRGQTRRLLAEAIRPFFLRRTKAEVAPELPEKCEQILWCDLGEPQRALYEELRVYYRQRLADPDGAEGTLLLEALLRLRQAACHPGLVNPNHKGGPSAKLEVLTASLAQLAAEGHKALVFSQFTQLLDLVSQELQGRFTYEVLTGATRDRRACVERFQSDPACQFFLISLKAGGVGLNLTSADYVFLLDPWWNPAAEAQAMDRAHRIGQTRKVQVYRLVARGTVEEKILALQAEKRALFEEVIGGSAPPRGLTQDDLERLLG